MEEIASVYARSLFEVAQEHNKLDVVRDQLGEFADALNETRELQVFFFSPYFSTPEKKDGLEKAVTGTEPILTNFLELMIDSRDWSKRDSDMVGGGDVALVDKEDALKWCSERD